MNIFKTTKTTERHHIRIVPHLESESNCDFSPSEHVLFNSTKLVLGRFTDTYVLPDRIAFKSMAVSRKHAVIFVSAGKYYIWDAKSSSGTFLNGQRLSLPYQSSSPHLLKEGDIIQLGNDCHLNGQVVYRCVKMKVYMSFMLEGVKSIGYVFFFFFFTKSIKSKNNSQDELGECCICLSNMLQDQKLFSIPCSHIFHFDCCRPLFIKHYPIFKCPMCRSHVNLTNVA
ncbi:hypothetical protein K501DRAFT_187252 [Backusella circina FSU 941]|nr:hypothetical protein K501DRAFT_187252 [Backusella circina FSU 941]